MVPETVHLATAAVCLSLPDEGTPAGYLAVAFETAGLESPPTMILSVLQKLGIISVSPGHWVTPGPRFASFKAKLNENMAGHPGWEAVV